MIFLAIHGFSWAPQKRRRRVSRWILLAYGGRWEMDEDFSHLGIDQNLKQDKMFGDEH